MKELNSDPVPVEFSFVYMKENIQNSDLFHLLKTLPKGGLLHSHDTSAQDMHLYVDASYLPGCLYSLNENDYGSLSFYPTEGYVPISKIRDSWYFY